MRSNFNKCSVSLVILLFFLAAAFFSAEIAMAQTKEEAIETMAVTQAGEQIKLKMTRPTAKKNYVIGMLVPHLRDPFWVSNAYGLIDEAEKLGVKPILLAAGGYLEIGKQIAQMEDLLQRKVDAVLLSPVSFEGTAAVVEEAVKKGIPVLNNGMRTKSDKISSIVNLDDEGIGRLQGEYTGKRLQGKGKIVMLNGPAGAKWAIDRVKGFKDAISSKYPGIKILGERWSEMDRAILMKIMEDFLQAFGGEIDFVYTVTGLPGRGAADAIRAAGKKGKIGTSTVLSSPEDIEFMKEGLFEMMVGQSPVLMGRWSVDLAVRVLNGETVPKVVYVPGYVLTKDNMNTYDFTYQFSPKDWKVPF